MLANEIETIVKQIIELNKVLTKSEIDLLPEFDEFKTQNKLFYEVIFSPDFNSSIFKEMMKMKRRLEDGEDQYSVDTRFGKFMSDIYLEPVVSKLKETQP
jgi:hypothetical protein